MGRKHRKKPLGKDVSDVVHRIAWLLEHVWRGSIAHMAAALGVSHAALTRVLNGQTPSGKMLEALARRPDINIRWVLCDEGDPLVVRGQSPVGVLCPLAEVLLPGQPRDCPEMLSPFSLPVASPVLIESAYWYMVKGGDPIVADKRQKVAAGDYLLVETSARWTRRPAAYAGRIVAFRLPEGGVAVGRVAEDEELFQHLEETRGPRYKVDTFGQFEAALLFSGLSRDSSDSDPKESESGTPELRCFYQDDVVGICLQLARLLGRIE